MKHGFIMTSSPAITKSPKSEKKSPSHSTGAAKEAAGSTTPPQPAEAFSWFRVFKLADLMMKQGC